MRGRLDRALLVSAVVIVAAVLLGLALPRLMAVTVGVAIFVAAILIVNTSRLRSRDGEKGSWRQADGSWHSKHEE